MSAELSANLLSTTAVAKHCFCVHSTVVRWIQSGRLKAYTTPGGRYRIDPDVLVEFMKENEMYVPRELQESVALRVVVVTEDTKIRRVIEGILAEQEDSFEVRPATGGFDGCMLVGDFKPHLVIIDVALPGVDVFDMSNSINSYGDWTRPRIIVLTSFPLRSVTEKACNSGAADCLAKPVRRKEFVEKVRTVLGLD